MKKKIMILLAFGLLFLGTTCGTFAYFTAVDKATNIVSSGAVKIKVVDSDIPINLMPSVVVENQVKVTCTDTHPAYVRVIAKLEVYMQNGQIYTWDISDCPVVNITVNTDNWTLLEDGYYYYNNSLDFAETTESLFENLQVSPYVGNEYENAVCTLKIDAVATQVENNGESVFEAAGWPEI